MIMADPLQELMERFRQAGCRDPEGWASSEIQHGIPQFARFVFLRELWKCAASRGSHEWLRHLDLPNDDGKGGVKRRLKESTASIDDLTELVRAAQAEVVRNVAYLLDGYVPDEDLVEKIRWGLFELDDDLKPARELDGLHESVDDDEFHSFR
ncbi:MAG: hypothetical protein JSS02_22765 [Planctomycetes bacterium]|nr:hypothetical protein [Planctomycetota bacterium]